VIGPGPLEAWTFPQASQLGMVAAGKSVWATIDRIARDAEIAGATPAEVERWIKYSNRITLEGLDRWSGEASVIIAAMREHEDAIEPFSFWLENGDEQLDFQVSCLGIKGDPAVGTFRVVRHDGSVFSLRIDMPPVGQCTPKRIMLLLVDAIVTEAGEW
jgi:hypothetical protein